MINFALEYQWFIVLHVNQMYNLIYKTLYVAATVNANTCIAEKIYIFAIYIHQGKYDFFVIMIYLHFYIVHGEKDFNQWRVVVIPETLSLWNVNASLP